MTQPQQAAEQVGRLMQALPKPFTDIVTTTNTKLQQQATDVVASLPKETLADMQGLVGSLAPALQMMMQGGLGGAMGGGLGGAMGGVDPAALYAQQQQYALQQQQQQQALAQYYMSQYYGAPQASPYSQGYYGYAAGAAEPAQAMPQAMMQGGAQPQQGAQQQYNAQLQAMQQYYMQQIKYAQEQMAYLQQLQVANAPAGGGHAQAAAA